MEKFLKELSTNAELQKKARELTTPESLFELAKPYLDEKLSFEDFKRELALLARKLGKVQSNDSKELSEDDLEEVSGGFVLTLSTVLPLLLGAIGGLAMEVGGSFVYDKLKENLGDR